MAAAVAGVGVIETAAVKPVSLGLRTAMDVAGPSQDPGPSPVSHVYDLHMMGGRLDRGAVAKRARVIAAADAREFANQYPLHRQ